ncbi:hypothetical protein [Erwinia sp. 9145]|uniref:hypothetical protein n=1 Tax=Erwinia sp. 9145 TaxID=1500895 RepID=UPI000557AA31|nr:hypothetical protein [Erwinia sp. 9145]
MKMYKSGGQDTYIETPYYRHHGATFIAQQLMQLSNQTRKNSASASVLRASNPIDIMNNGASVVSMAGSFLSLAALFMDMEAGPGTTTFGDKYRINNYSGGTLVHTDASVLESSHAGYNTIPYEGIIQPGSSGAIKVTWLSSNNNDRPLLYYTFEVGFSWQDVRTDLDSEIGEPLGFKLKFQCSRNSLSKNKTFSLIRLEEISINHSAIMVNANYILSLDKITENTQSDWDNLDHIWTDYPGGKMMAIKIHRLNVNFLLVISCPLVHYDYDSYDAYRNAFGNGGLVQINLIRI